MTRATKLAIVCVLIAAGLLAAFARAPGSVAQEPTARPADMSFTEFRPTRVARQARAHEIREQKCQPHERTHFRLASFEIPGWRRADNLAYWRGKVERAIELRNVCMTYAHHTSLWLCIHSREGAWNDPNAPYFGGLQMGYWFMETYGGDLYRRKGTADNWTAAEQMAVADRAYHEGGHSTAWLYGQWPNTAPPCT